MTILRSLLPSVSGVTIAPNAGAPALSTALVAADGSTFTIAQILALAGATTTYATAATLSGAPGTGTAGTAITGLTTALTPTGSTAFASITVGGAEQTPRTPFSGAAVPSLTPAAAGSATISIYGAAAGGSALITSGTIAVAAASSPATGATISGAPSAGTVGAAIVALTAALTPSGATAYASLSIGGAEQTPRTSFTGTGIPSLIPATAGTATISIYAAASGGSALATSGSITVSAAASGSNPRYTLSNGSTAFSTTGAFGGNALAGAGTSQITITGPEGIAPTSFYSTWTRSNTVVPTPGTGGNQYGSNTQEFAAGSVRAGYPNLWDLNTYVWAKGSPTTGAYYLWVNWTDSSGSGWTVFPAMLTMSA